MASSDEKIQALERRLATAVRESDHRLAQANSKIEMLRQEVEIVRSEHRRQVSPLHERIATLKQEIDQLQSERDELARQLAEADRSRAEQDERAQHMADADELRAERDALARQLAEAGARGEPELGFVITELERIARSGTWRWGHRLANLKWRLTFHKPDDQIDAVNKLLRRLQAPALPPGDPALPAGNADLSSPEEPSSEMAATDLER